MADMLKAVASYELLMMSDDATAPTKLMRDLKDLCQKYPDLKVGMQWKVECSTHQQLDKYWKSARLSSTATLPKPFSPLLAILSILVELVLGNP